MESDKKKRVFLAFQWSWASVMILLNVATIVFLVWTSNKGLDITDESIYLMATRFPDEIKVAASTFYIYTSIIFNLVGYNLMALRIISVLLMVSSSIILFLGMYKLLKSLDLKFFSRVSVAIAGWSLLSMGALLHYAWWLLTPGYNHLNSIALNAAAGFLLLGLSLLENSKGKYMAYAFFCMAGLCSGISLLVKFSTGISLFAIIVTFFLFWPGISFLVKIRNIASFVIGIVVWLSIHFGLLQSPALWWQAFQRGIENALLLNPAYGMANINRYLLECVDILKTDFLRFWKFYLSVIAGGSVLLIMRKSERSRNYLFPALLLILLAATGWKSYHVYFSAGFKNVYTGHIMIVYTVWIAVLVLAILVARIYHQKSIAWKSTQQNQLILTGTILLLIPFAGVVGTGNAIYTCFFLYVTPWFALLAILLVVLSKLCGSQWVFNCGTIIISLLACAQITSGVLMAPYRLNTPMRGQTVYTDIGSPSTRLMLDPAASTFFNKLQEAAKDHGFKPGDDMLAFSDLAGVVFALGGKSPYITHYTSGYQGSHAANERTLSMIPKERIKRAFILQNVSGKSWRGRVEEGTDGFPDLTKFGIDFPGDYVLCGEATGTYYDDLIRLWKPK